MSASERRRWYVITPAGRAGPYSSKADAQSAARPFGWAAVAHNEGGEVCEHGWAGDETARYAAPSRCPP